MANSNQDNIGPNNSITHTVTGGVLVVGCAGARSNVSAENAPVCQWHVAQALGQTRPLNKIGVHFIGAAPAVMR